MIVYSRISSIKKCETVLVRQKQFFTFGNVYSELCVLAWFEYICLAFNGKGKCFALSLHWAHHYLQKLVGLVLNEKKMVILFP